MKKIIPLYEDFLNEKKEYEIYHNTYTDAIDTALNYVKKKGYSLEDEEIWTQISTGPGKPKDGETRKISLQLYKKDKTTKKYVHMQIYGMGKRYELNLYIS